MTFGIFANMVCIVWRWVQNRKSNLRTRSFVHLSVVCVCYSQLLPFAFTLQEYTQQRTEQDRKRSTTTFARMRMKEPNSKAESYRYLFCIQFIWPLRSYGMRNTYVMSFIFCVCSFTYFFIGNCCCRWCCCFLLFLLLYFVALLLIYRCGVCVCVCCRFNICSSHYLSRSGWCLQRLQFLVHRIALCVGNKIQPKEGIVASLLSECSCVCVCACCSRAQKYQ